VLNGTEHAEIAAPSEPSCANRVVATATLADGSVGFVGALGGAAGVAGSVYLSDADGVAYLKQVVDGDEAGGGFGFEFLLVKKRAVLGNKALCDAERGVVVETTSKGSNARSNGRENRRHDSSVVCGEANSNLCNF